MKKYTIYFEKFDLCLFTCSFDSYAEFYDLWHSFTIEDEEFYNDSYLDMKVPEQVLDFFLNEAKTEVVRCSTLLEKYLVTLCKN